MLGVKRYEVRLEPHNREWASLFEVTRKEIQRLLGSNVKDIQHIGSTAIEGIVAKPILDIAVVVCSLSELNIAGMEAAGFICMGELGVPGRCYFVKRKNDDVSTHHIHCYEEGNQNLRECIAFRDFLASHTYYAMQYSHLKTRLCEKFQNDRAKYTEEKTDFVKMILRLAYQNP